MNKPLNHAGPDEHGRFGSFGGRYVAETLTPGSLGTFSWGGLANTFFWIDPVEEVIAIQATQMIPTGCFPIRPQFQQLVYAALDW